MNERSYVIQDLKNDKGEVQDARQVGPSGSGGADENAVHYNESDGKSSAEQAQALANAGAEPAKLVPIYYMDTLAGVNFNPTEFVDISEEIDLKLQMLECHESQLVWMREHDGIDFADMVKTCSRYRGYQCGAEYAEGFRPCQVYLKGTTKRLLP